MPDTVITVENLSKRYLIGHHAAERERDSTLRDTIVRGVRSFARKAIDVARGQHLAQGKEIEEFWALKDVSFEVKQGEVRRHYRTQRRRQKYAAQDPEPYHRAYARADRCYADAFRACSRSAPAFTPELTGRENIFLNGAILGHDAARNSKEVR